MNATDQPEWMTLAECAAWLRIPTRKVSQLSKGSRPLLRAFWINRRVVRFHRPTLIAALAQQDRAFIPAQSRSWAFRQQ